jgi:hypothetical protein
MIVKMMQHHRSLAVVAAALGQRRRLPIQLFDQSLLVRRDDIHDSIANRRPVEKRLPK